MMNKKALSGLVIPAFLILTPANPGALQSDDNEEERTSIIADRKDLSSQEFNNNIVMSLSEDKVNKTTSVKWEWEAGEIPKVGTLALSTNITDKNSNEEWLYIQKYENGELIENSLMNITEGKKINLKKELVTHSLYNVVGKFDKSFNDENIEITGIASYTPLAT